MCANAASYNWHCDGFVTLHWNVIFRNKYRRLICFHILHPILPHWFQHEFNISKHESQKHFRQNLNKIDSRLIHLVKNHKFDSIIMFGVNRKYQSLRVNLPQFRCGWVDVAWLIQTGLRLWRGKLNNEQCVAAYRALLLVGSNHSESEWEPFFVRLSVHLKITNKYNMMK